jgi:hypothetical protein
MIDAAREYHHSARAVSASAPLRPAGDHLLALYVENQVVELCFGTTEQQRD